MTHFHHCFSGHSRDGEARERLRRLSMSLSRRGSRSARFRHAIRESIDDLQQDQGLLMLVVAALVSRLIERGVIEPDELLKHLGDLDGLDAAQDGAIDAEALREALGFPPRERVRPEPARPEPVVVTRRRGRRSRRSRRS